MTQNAANAYHVQQIMTATPAQLVVMLYERAQRALRDAIRSIDADDPQERFNHNKRAVDIISHLWSTLDMDQGGEIASNLADLYSFMIRRLADVDMKNDKQAAQDVISLLEPLCESWKQIAASGAGLPNIPDVPAPRPRHEGGIALSA